MSTNDRKQEFLDWVKAHYGEDIQRICAQELAGNQSTEYGVLLDRVLRERYAGPAPRSVSDLHFCSD
jgi:hypothetical protein